MLGTKVWTNFPPSALFIIYECDHIRFVGGRRAKKRAVGTETVNCQEFPSDAVGTAISALSKVTTRRAKRLFNPQQLNHQTTLHYGTTQSPLSII